MKKIFVLIFLIFFVSLGFTQETNSQKWSGTVRFKPLAFLVSAALSCPEVIIDWTPYVSKNIGIPIEFDVATFSGNLFFGAMSGVEAILLEQSEKSGLYIAGLAGLYFIFSDIVFAGKFDVGYQFLFKKGFVFTPAIGLKYNSVNGFNVDLMVDIGFAYK